MYTYLFRFLGGYYDEILGIGHGLVGHISAGTCTQYTILLLVLGGNTYAYACMWHKLGVQFKHIF